MDDSKLGELLVAYGLITRDQLDAVLKDQKVRDMRIGVILRLRGWIDDEQLHKMLDIQSTLRNKSAHKRSLAIADIAIMSYGSERSAKTRHELQEKAKKISDEYPIIFTKKEK